MSRLSRESIAEAAIAIADQDGVDAVSMRRVAQHLGVGTMSLYHHVRDKQALYTAMGDAIMAEQIIPADELPTGWREGLAEIGRRAYRLFRDHPWVVSSWHHADRAEPGETFFAHVEQTLGIVAELDFLAVSERMFYSGLVDEYAIGFVMHNAVGQDAVGDEDRWRAQLAATAATGDYPHLSAAMAELEGPPPDEFELGLQVLLDGIEASIERRR